MEGYYAAAFEGFDEDAAFYEGTFGSMVTVPEGFPITIPTTGRAVVDEAVDSIVPADILVSYPPRGMTKKAEEDSQNGGRWLRHAWGHVRSKGSDIDPMRDFARNLFMSGKACYKVVPDYTLWPLLPEPEEKALRELGGTALKDRVRLIKQIREENFPLTVRSLAPSCIMEDPTIANRKLWICERYVMSNAEVRSLYSQDVEEFRDQNFWGHSSYNIHELWTATYVDYKGKLHPGKHWVFINYGMVVEEDNPYHNIPYVLKYSGFGREAYEGSPEYKSVGFFTPQVKSMLLAEARRATHFDVMMSQLAFPIAFMSDKIEDANISFEPGAVNFVPEDVLANIQNTFISPHLPEAEYLSSLNYINGQIERGTVSRSVRGAPLPGADSAAQYSLQSNNAKLRMESCKQASEQAAAEVGSMWLQHVDKYLNGKVSVFGPEGLVDKYTLGSENIRGHYAVGITFQPNEDAIKERKLILANDAINKGGLSPFDAYQFAGFENPQELIGRRLAYDLMMSDDVKKYLAMQVLEEWGLDVRNLQVQGQMQDIQQQNTLGQFAQSLQVGTPAGGPPELTQPGQMPQQAQQPQQQPGQEQLQQQGPTGPMGGQGGAPQQQMPAELASMMGDMNAMASGVNPSA